MELHVLLLERKKSAVHNYFFQVTSSLMIRLENEQALLVLTVLRQELGRRRNLRTEFFHLPQSTRGRSSFLEVVLRECFYNSARFLHMNESVYSKMGLSYNHFVPCPLAQRGRPFLRGCPRCGGESWPGLGCCAVAAGLRDRCIMGYSD